MSKSILAQGTTLTPRSRFDRYCCSSGFMYIMMFARRCSLKFWVRWHFVSGAAIVAILSQLRLGRSLYVSPAEHLVFLAGRLAAYLGCISVFGWRTQGGRRVHPVEVALLHASKVRLAGRSSRLAYTRNTTSCDRWLRAVRRGTADSRAACPCGPTWGDARAITTIEPPSACREQMNSAGGKLEIFSWEAGGRQWMNALVARLCYVTRSRLCHGPRTSHDRESVSRILLLTGQEYELGVERRQTLDHISWLGGETGRDCRPCCRVARAAVFRRGFDLERHDSRGMLRHCVRYSNA